jgi:hypothetical protein
MIILYQKKRIMIHINYTLFSYAINANNPIILEKVLIIIMIIIMKIMKILLLAMQKIAYVEKIHMFIMQKEEVFVKNMDLSFLSINVDFVVKLHLDFIHKSIFVRIVMLIKILIIIIYLNE